MAFNGESNFPFIQTKEDSKPPATFFSVDVLLVEAICLWWIVLLKLQIFAFILFWLDIAVGFTTAMPAGRIVGFLLLFIAAVATVGVRDTKTNIRQDVNKSERAPISLPSWGKWRVILPRAMVRRFHAIERATYHTALPPRWHAIGARSYV